MFVTSVALQDGVPLAKARKGIHQGEFPIFTHPYKVGHKFGHYQRSGASKKHRRR
jgi:hypothetical protein